MATYYGAGNVDICSTLALESEMIVRRSDAPEFDVGYSEATGRVTFSEV
jgi:hypothetical protein